MLYYFTGLKSQNTSELIRQKWEDTISNELMELIDIKVDMYIKQQMYFQT